MMTWVEDVMQNGLYYKNLQSWHNGKIIEDGARKHHKKINDFIAEEARKALRNPAYLAKDTMIDVLDVQNMSQMQILQQWKQNRLDILTGSKQDQPKQEKPGTSIKSNTTPGFNP